MLRLRTSSQFDTCVATENRDLVRRLTFGGYVLLHRNYWTPTVPRWSTGQEEADGLDRWRKKSRWQQVLRAEGAEGHGPGQEHCCACDGGGMVRPILALRENRGDGRYWSSVAVQPRIRSAPEPKGKAVAITFDGPVPSLTRAGGAVGHSGCSPPAGGMWRTRRCSRPRRCKCGLFLHVRGGAGPFDPLFPG